MTSTNYVLALAGQCIAWAAWHYPTPWAWAVAGFGLGLVFTVRAKHAAS